jgi:hypothetical protein
MRPSNTTCRIKVFVASMRRFRSRSKVEPLRVRRYPDTRHRILVQFEWLRPSYQAGPLQRAGAHPAAYRRNPEPINRTWPQLPRRGFLRGRSKCAR